MHSDQPNPIKFFHEGVKGVIPEDVFWIFQQIFQCEEELLVNFIQIWAWEKIELLAECCNSIVNSMPRGDQEILGYVLAHRSSGFDWFLEQYFWSDQVLKNYIAEFEQYCAIVQSRLQASA